MKKMKEICCQCEKTQNKSMRDYRRFGHEWDLKEIHWCLAENRSRFTSIWDDVPSRCPFMAEQAVSQI